MLKHILEPQIGEWGKLGKYFYNTRFDLSPIMSFMAVVLNLITLFFTK